ncbi:kinase-like protein [Cucurbitaria berberidis CBS 394.84]|uniref:Kinase-like protein n=1 Tax=Cucurbitaria berberidis CBS 394.84 TaxID=1168544 RepID=A0A9P4L3U1_9PLEO|nr:kinase-like protein [Cucurbitaria berberidis CBS 394.84]KAF1840143.1 kinase-like protein [Cucurbitaria berberidis CBS 394.84]
MNPNGGPPQILYIEEGKDYFLDDNEELPYRLVKNLGHGHSATVEEVVDQWTGAVYARKVFRINGSKSERRRIFSNEIKIIRRLERHHHIVRVFATYISRRETGLILSPVASQGDLESFLQDFREGRCTESGMHTLISAFGCLASGLLFMHTQHVRHKDIKPRNILVHQNTVIYTDFGYSLDHSTATGSTTTGRPHTLTRKYCAPEVQEWEPRNAKSDIFSLGCVFFEIFATLGFCELPDTGIPYHERIDEVKAMVRGSIGPVNEWFKPIGSLTCQMIDSSPEQRPPANNIARELWKNYRGHFCPQCRQSLPAQNATEFPPQPMHEYYNLVRTNFTAGWIASDEMVSGGILLDQMQNGQHLEARNGSGSWTPIQAHAGAIPPPTHASPNGLHGSVARDQFPLPSPGLVATSGADQAYYPPTPVDIPLRRSSTVLQSVQTPSQALDPTSLAESPKSVRNLVAIPYIDFRPQSGQGIVQVESSPKTYAMALSGDRDRTPTVDSSHRLPCLHANCPDMFTSQTKLQTHMLRHTTLFTCRVVGCRRTDFGFSTADDLERHMNNVHRTGGMTWTHYQCIVEDCANRNKIWPQLSSFKKHIIEVHPRGNQDDLIQRSTLAPSKKAPRRKQSSFDTER